MKEKTQQRKSEEIELKLALPFSDRDDLIRRLKMSAPLARRKSITQNLSSIYYDTPEQDLLKRHIALRIRQVDSRTDPVWIQTLKTGGEHGSALSIRGEWEAEVPSGDLSMDALRTSPWREIDPDGTIYQTLAPCFSTQFERTSWQVRAKDHSVVEVAFDRGQIQSGGQHAPICELEFELMAGVPSSLFDLAGRISQTVAVLPASVSKAERGYALALGTLDMPQRSRPPLLSTDQAVMQAGQQVLREMFSQFTRNMDILQSTDNPEVVHQARVGWRRFKSALRLFRPVLDQDQIPEISTLQPLLTSLSQLRDLDVALTETLPSIAHAYTCDDLDRQRIWHQFEHSLTQAAQIQRNTVRTALQEPAVGTTLLRFTRFIEEMISIGAGAAESKTRPLKPWAERRLQKLRNKLDQSIEGTADKRGQHRARILAKRLRYGLESMQTILPKRLVKRWLKRATALQGSIGTSRDFQRTFLFASELGAEASLVEFLRGYGCGMDHRNDNGGLS